ncbi:MAG: PQQ-binding-like beta-propeller repeat protein [Anaerolineae bacterium]
MAYTWQARLIARGFTLTTPTPPCPTCFLVPFVVDAHGQRSSKYPPAWSVVLALGERMNARAWVNPFLAGLSVWLIYRLGKRLAGAPVGVLAAFDLRTGRSVWPRPFTVPALAGGRGDIVAAPLIVGETIYVGSHDRRLYAVEAATGIGRPLAEVARGIACAPAWVEGLVVFGTNDGVLYAVDAATRDRVWQVSLGGHINVGPLVADGALFAASDNGTVVALPWHGGRYEWAAARLEAQGRRDEAGDCHALAAHFAANLAAQEEGYRRAAAAWEQADRPEKAGHMWLDLGARWRRPAADALRRAGLAHCGRDPRRAAAYLKKAADLYYELYTARPLGEDTAGLAAALNESTQALAECAGLPRVAVRVDNLDSLVQWEQGHLALRLTNTGAAAIKGEVRITIGGGFAELVEARLLGDLRAKGQWRVPVTAVAVRPQSLLEIEVEYDSGHPDYGPLRTILLQPTTAAARPRPPVYTYTFGDVGMLKLSAGRADDGSVVQVVTGDVGLISARGGQIGSVTVRGDVAASVGADPATRQQVADLAAAVGWLGERLARLETAAGGAAPATAEEIHSLRGDLAAQRAFLETLLARLADDQQAAVAGLAADLKLLADRLDALGRA